MIRFLSMLFQSLNAKKCPMLLRHAQSYKATHSRDTAIELWSLKYNKLINEEMSFVLIVVHIYRQHIQCVICFLICTDNPCVYSNAEWK
jgi:hypothetical protein